MPGWLSSPALLPRVAPVARNRGRAATRGREAGAHHYVGIPCDILARTPSSRHPGVMADRRICDDSLCAHFLTFSCERRRRLLDHDHPKRVVLSVLGEQLAHQAARCAGFVVMPDHVHAVIWLPEPGQLSRFMHEWKRRSSYQIRAWYRAGEARYFDRADFGD